MGKKKRQVGWFPASYVKLMGGPEKATPEPKKPQFRALYSYAGQHDDELGMVSHEMSLITIFGSRAFLAKIS